MTHRLTAVPARHPLLVDAALAVAVATLAILADVLGPNHRSDLAVVWDLLLAAPLVVRRRTPAAAAAAIGTVCLLQWLSGDLANADLVVLIMLYTLGAWERRLWVLGSAVVVAEAGVIMAVSRWDPDGRPWLSALLLSGTVTASWVIGCYVRMRRAFVTSMVERAETAERDRDTRSRIAVVEERARMAREMHDIVAHSLSVMITLNDAVAALAPEGPLRGTAVQAGDVGRQALEEMQRLLGVLRRDGAVERGPQPGTAQVGELLTSVRSAGLAVDFTVTGDPGTVSASEELVIFRIVQESLTNVLKHAANVETVEVGLAYRDDRVIVRVRNDGDPVRRTSPPDDRHGVGGHGLTGMRERAGLFGGRVDAAPGRDGGWVVTAEIPTPEPAIRR